MQKLINGNQWKSMNNQWEVIFVAGTGGIRVGAGRTEKPLKDKILEGKAKTAKILKMDMVGEDMPPPSEFLSEPTKGASNNNAQEIYVKTWN